MKQTIAKLVNVIYFHMKTKQEDELIALINFISRRNTHNTSKIWRNTTPDLGQQQWRQEEGSCQNTCSRMASALSSSGLLL